MAFTVAIIGRPNVGKSTLFNRLVGRRLALVDDLPGVTRDRREAEASYGDLAFRVIDTAGLEVAGPETLQGRMRRQTEAAVAEADLVLFVVDARAGVTKRRKLAIVLDQPQPLDEPLGRHELDALEPRRPAAMLGDGDVGRLEGHPPR